MNEYTLYVQLTIKISIEINEMMEDQQRIKKGILLPI